MSKLAQHPTVKKVRGNQSHARGSEPRERLDAERLKQIVRDAGADDVGLLSVDRAEIDDQRQDILEFFPGTRTLIAVVCRMNRDPIRSPARSVANLEFHHTGDVVNDVSRSVVRELEKLGYRAYNPPMGFPMEADRFPGKIWTVSHKPVAAAAGLGQIGIHRNLIHPRFGSFVLLGTILTDVEVTAEDRPIDYNPCLGCRLCVAACPVGAIKSDGHFDFSACYTHNYREFMGGFTEWTERLVGSKSVREYRSKVTDAESTSMWQSLSFGANYKAAYCLAVCPAGEDVISPWLGDRKQFTADVVRPLQEKQEPVYVVAGSDAEEHVRARFPHKEVRQVGSGLRPTSIRGFLDGLPHLFQRKQAGALDAVYHFTFRGDEEATATVTIRRGTLEVQEGHRGKADVAVVVDSKTWIGFLRRERGLLLALLTRKIRIHGSPRLLLKFGRCFAT